MPSKYVLRNFSENRTYHVFNRGVEKRNIFQDAQDYNLFIYYIFIYLIPTKLVLKKYPHLPIRLENKNLYGEVELLGYCLMPNHFHLLLLQYTKNAVPKFLKQLSNAYIQYFNQKYKRVGALFQGRYKAVEVKSDELLIHINRYIHLNPLVAELIDDLKSYKWSSYLEYIGRSKTNLCSKDHVLSQFRSRNNFVRFTLDHADYAKRLESIKHFTIDFRG